MDTSMNLNLFQTERDSKHKLFCNFNLCVMVSNGITEAVEKFYKIELTDEDVAICKMIVNCDSVMKRNGMVKLTSEYGDFYNIYSWCCRYHLFPLKGSYRRFLAQRGIKENIDILQTFEMVWKHIDLLYGWNKK